MRLFFTTFDVDYLNASTNLIQFLAMKLHQEPVFIDGMVNSTEDEFHEGRPKSVVVPETIDAVRQLILKDRDVTYREIETILYRIQTGIFINSIFVYL